MTGPDTDTGNRVRSFIARQFAIESTRPQRIFDWIFGAGLFGLAFLLSPDWNLLEASRLGHQLFKNADTPVLVYCVLAWVSLAGALVEQKHRAAIHLLLAPGLFLGAIMSLLTGTMELYVMLSLLVYLPCGCYLSLPWITSFAFLRNGVRSVRISAIRYGPITPVLLAVLILGLLLAVVFPYVEEFPPWHVMFNIWSDISF